MGEQHHRMIIIGSGPAGLTAAIYAARAGMQPMVIAGYTPGGQLMNTTVVENYPGFPDGIDGPLLMQHFMKQAEKWGAVIKYEEAQAVDFAGSPKKVTTDKATYTADTVIIATGALPRKLAIPGEDTYWAHGVSSCATCDGALFKGRTVAVIGGGDSAMEEALFLTNHAAKVYVVHRRAEFRASKIMSDRVLNNPKIEVLWNSEVKEVKGDGTVVTHLAVFNSQENTTTDLPVDGMFLAIGHIPVTGFLGGITLSDMGYVESIDGVHTNIEAVFVAGDVEDHKYRQAVTAAGAGCRAALEAQKWLEAHG